MDHVSIIASELGARAKQIQATTELLASGATVPFIARYRKEVTGSLDEVAVAAVRDRTLQLGELQERREVILASLSERGLLDNRLSQRVADARTLLALEDVYLPYRPKRRTRAMAARGRGLEPLARTLKAQTGRPINVAPFVDPDRGVEDREAALAGARDILAEDISEDLEVRRDLRRLFSQQGLLISTVVKKKQDQAAKFRDYFAWSEPLARAPSHRILAVLRGSNEGFLRVQARPDGTDALSRLARRYLRAHGFAADQVRLAIEDAYKRLLLPSLEREALKEAKARADEGSIAVFVTNLRELLMAAPFPNKPLLAIDPGFRTGCKVVALDAQGRLRHNTTVFQSQDPGRSEEAANALRDLVERFSPAAIGVGQYQHDVDQARLRSALDDTVLSCVNAVGVDLNSASASLLTYVAGLGPTLANNVVGWRKENGAFRTRRDLLKVPRLGDKAFEQAAGFLRISGGANVLDSTGVHPERYRLVERIARDQGCATKDLLKDPALRSRIDPDHHLAEGVGRPTLDDILKELASPGRDPRPEFEMFSFAETDSLADLRPGMVLPGIVTNVTAFGAFVDVGVHQDGLVHISELSDRFVKDPNEVVHVRQQVQVRVLQVDVDRERIGLSMKKG